MQTQAPVATALDMALTDIENALKANLFYLALVGTMTVIDMCAALESQDGRTSRTKLAAWYDANLAARYPWLKGEDCYGLRCGLVHQGIAKTDAQGHQSHWKRVLFLLPTGVTTRNSAVGDAYITDLSEFCRDVCSQVRTWAASHKDSPNVQKNIQNLMKYYPNGVEGYIQGMPLLG